MKISAKIDKKYYTMDIEGPNFTNWQMIDLQNYFTLQIRDTNLLLRKQIMKQTSPSHLLHDPSQIL